MSIKGTRVRFVDNEHTRGRGIAGEVGTVEDVAAMHPFALVRLDNFSAFPVVARMEDIEELKGDNQ